MKYFIVCVLLSFLSSAWTFATEEHPSDASALSRAEQTLNGLFHYFWRSDPHRKHVQFFFACGQIGGGGTGAQYGSCSCVNPSACVYCYRWWDAVALESVATYGIYMKTKNHSNIASTIFAHSPYNANWNATLTCTFIDDFSWYGIAYLRVYEWLKVYCESSYLESNNTNVIFLYAIVESYLAESFRCSARLGMGVRLGRALWWILVEQL